jgi:hypothetical protein
VYNIYLSYFCITLFVFWQKLKRKSFFTLEWIGEVLALESASLFSSPLLTIWLGIFPFGKEHPMISCNKRNVKPGGLPPFLAWTFYASSSTFIYTLLGNQNLLKKFHRSLYHPGWNKTGCRP